MRDLLVTSGLDLDVAREVYGEVLQAGIRNHAFRILYVTIRVELMQTKACETPVAMFVFNRPDATRRVFEAISEARPVRLLLVADGARIDKPGEAELCRHVREIVSSVDWPCEVSMNFAEENLGCGERVISGLNWVFSLVDKAIILEDDCLPDQTFFPFCSELLEMYRDDTRIAYITGTNFITEKINSESSYYFSRLGGIWGWATWKSRWLQYDRYLVSWPQLKKDNILYEIFADKKIVNYCTRIFDSMYERRGPDTWDYQWFFTCLKNDQATAVPSVNLIKNIGFGAEATHTANTDAQFSFPTSPINFPLRHPASFVPIRSNDLYHSRSFSPGFIQRLSNKIRRTLHR